MIHKVEILFLMAWDWVGKARNRVLDAFEGLPLAARNALIKKMQKSPRLSEQVVYHSVNRNDRHARLQEPTVSGIIPFPSHQLLLRLV